MASGTVTFQTATTVTPNAALSVMGDSVADEHGAGTAQYIKIMDGATGGTVKASVTANGLVVDTRGSIVGTVQLHGIAQVLGTVRALGDITVGTITEGTIQSFTGTAQVLGTIQPLAGSVHVANVVFGTFQAHGTAQILGTTQPLAGSVHLASPLPGTMQVLGTTQAHGTTQALGTVQPLAGSVHPAAIFFGSVQGWQAHDGAAAGNPVLFGGFGSSGTQPAVGDGDAVRAWFDLNGRQVIRGTIDSLVGTVQTHGTSQVLGTTQPLAGSVHLASGLPGTVQVLGTIQAHGTTQILGTVQTAGTVDIGTVRFVVGTINIGTIQAGSVHVANTAAVLGTTSFVTGGTAHIGSVQRLTGGTLDFLGGTVAVGTVRQVLGTVLTRPSAAGEGFFGTRFTAAVTNGTLVPAPSAGTYVRVWGLVASGSAAGSAFFELGDGTIFGAIFTAANGGMVYTSAKGIRTNGTAQDIFFNCAAGTWGVSVEYTLETA